MHSMDKEHSWALRVIDLLWFRALTVPMHLDLMALCAHNLISAQESPVPLPKFQMAIRLKILILSGSKKGAPIYYPFFLKNSRQANPLQVPQWGPLGLIYPLAGHFYISLNITLILFLSESPVRELPPCSLTGTPWKGILHHQSHWSIYLFIHSCMSAGVPKKEPSYIWQKT